MTILITSSRIIFSIILGLYAFVNIKFLFFTRFDVTKRMFESISLYRTVWFQLAATLLSLVALYVLVFAYPHIKQPVFVTIALGIAVLVFAILGGAGL